MHKLATVTFLTLALGGCADLRAQRAAEDAEICKAQGATPGTDAYAHCLQQQRDEQRKADTEAAAARANQPQPITCSTIGAQVICKTP